MACETKLRVLQRMLREALEELRNATEVVQECSLDNPESALLCFTWEEKRDQFDWLVNHCIPGRLRRALREGRDELREVWLIRFRRRTGAANASKASDKNGDGKLPEEEAVTGYIRTWLGNSEYEPDWPDFAAARKKIDEVCDGFRRDRIKEFTITVDDVKTIVLNTLRQYEVGMRRQADGETGRSRELHIEFANRAPIEGIRCDELPERVFEFEPAADAAAVEASCHELQRAGQIEKVDQLIERADRKTSGWKQISSPCLVLRGARESAGEHEDEAGFIRRQLDSIPALDEGGEWLSAQDVARLVLAQKGRAFHNSKSEKDAINRVRRNLATARCRAKVRASDDSAGIDGRARKFRKDRRGGIWYFGPSVPERTAK